MEINNKKLKVIKSAPLPQVEYIESFAQDNSIKLPENLKNFILNYNPITVEETLYSVNGNTYMLNGFYPFGFTEGLTLQKAYQNMKEIYEDKYIAFADDPGGWEYVIALKEEDYGKVYLCRMDEELEDGLVKLADSFANFINGLHIEGEIRQ